MEKLLMLFLVFIVIMTLTGTTECKASGWEGGMIVNSWHHDRDKGYNESNEGILLQHAFDDYRLGGMTFKNSYGDQATTVFCGKDYYNSQYLDLGVNLHLVTGYHNMENFTPVPLLTATVKPWSHKLAPSLAIQGLPGVVYGFGLGWNF